MRCSGADYVVNFQRLVDLAEPFRAIGGAAAAAFVKRQLELAQQARDLLSRRDLTPAGARSQGRFVKIVQCGQASRKEFAVNHTLGKTVDRAKAEPERQFLQSFRDELFVARSKHRQPVANNDPVGARAIDLAAPAPR